MTLKKVLICGALLAGVAHGAVPQVTVEALFGTNYIHGATLSPDGTKIAFLAPKGDTYSIAILDLVTRKVVIPFHPEGDSIESVVWKGNDHLVFRGIIDGVEAAPLVAVTNLDGSRIFSLMRPSRNTVEYYAQAGDVVNYLKNDPDHILVFGSSLDGNPRTSAGEAGAAMLMKINIQNGVRTLVCPAVDPERFVSLGDFGIDHAGAVRTAYRSKDEIDEMVYRDDSTLPWRPIHRHVIDSGGWVALGFTGDNKGVYIVDQESSDLGSLRVFDPSTGTLGPALFTPAAGEIDSLIFSPDTKRLIGLRYEDDKLRYHWFEAKYADLQKRMENTFPDHDIAFSGISDDETRILIRTHSDRDPGAYYLLDLTKGTLGLVTTVGSTISPKAMAPMLPVSFKARDGLTIHGYLTLPLDFKRVRPVPLVVHPHGGPYGIRDSWGFDPEVQMLANRGYAVIQVNYRGSGGYGHAFLKAGYREWGRTMQDDLTDSVKWAIDQGYADPTRVGIYGASYGGYATLAGLTFTPELYKCGVNYVGVADIPELLRVKYGTEQGAYLAYKKFVFGDDPKRLYDQSPVHFVERIRAPLLNAYGENDKRVEIYQWKELKAELDKYHKNYEYMVAAGEGHGFAHVDDAVAFYTRVDEFLKKNL